MLQCGMRFGGTMRNNDSIEERRETERGGRIGPNIPALQEAGMAPD
jgi:hypothetical protein